MLLTSRHHLQLSGNDQRRLIKIVADILGDEEGLLNEQLQDLLHINNVIHNLWTAFTYTSRNE